MNTQKYVSLIVALAMIGSFALAVPAFAVDNQNNNSEQGQAPAVVGTVSAISGITITVVGKQVPGDANANTVFTVNTNNAQWLRGNTAITLSSVAVGDNVTVQGTVTGTNVVATIIRDSQANQDDRDSEKMMPAVVGKVSIISGKILTVISKQGFDKSFITETTDTTTFTVDATNAKLLRGNTAITLADIAVDDNVVVQGIVTDTNIVATLIRDGKVGNGNSNKGDNNQALLQIQGNGQPVIAGTVSAINGSTLTVANASVTYAVDATNAKIVQGKNTISLSGVKTGDSVIVQGIVNGTSVAASTIIDSNATTHLGFFASIGRWFRNLFGF